MSIAYWCVLLAAILPYLAVGVAKTLSPYDNRSPRAPGTYQGVALRAHSAHQNSLEAFPLFAAAVIVGSGGAATVSICLLDILAVVWIALRLIYIGVYIADLATLRSIVWIAALVVATAIFTMPAWR